MVDSTAKYSVNGYFSTAHVFAPSSYSLVHVCMHAYVCECMCVCVCMCVGTLPRDRSFLPVSPDFLVGQWVSDMQFYPPTHMHACTHIHTAHTYTHSHTHMRTCSHRHTDTHTHTHSHTHTHARTYTHTHTHNLYYF